MSNYPAGSFTCAQLQIQKQRAAEAFREGGIQNQQWRTQAETVKAIMANQTAQIAKLEDPNKDYTVSLYWINDCESGQGDCTNQCTVGGPELSTDCKTYELDLCTSFGFNVKESFRDSNLDMNEVVAKGILSTERKLNEWVNRQVIAKLDLLAGDNAAPSNANHVVDNAANTTTIPAALWDASLQADFYQDAVINNMSNAYGISGFNLHKSNYLARKRAGNADGAGDAAMVDDLKIYHDLKWLDSELGEKATFMINPNAVFVATKAYFPSAPKEYGGSVGQTRWSKSSSDLPGFVYDWIYTLSCTDNVITHKYSAYVKMGVFGSPLMCDGGYTGVLKYVCG